MDLHQNGPNAKSMDQHQVMGPTPSDGPSPSNGPTPK